MKIGLIIYGSLDTLSGGYLYDRQLVAHLRAAGYQVEILSLPWRTYTSHIRDNFRVVWARQIANAGYDLLLQDELNHPSFFLLNSLLRRLCTCPIISIVHHLRTSEDHPARLKSLYRIIERRYLESVDGFIFNSQTTHHVVQHLIRYSKPYTVAYPAADHRQPPDHAVVVDAIAKRLQLNGPLQLLFIGNLMARKGLHTVLDALARLEQNWHLHIVGSQTVDAAYSDAVRQQANTLGLASHITWYGQANDQTLNQLLSSSDLLVMPSYEGFGIVYLEAMAFGLPVLAANFGAAPEMIDLGINGYLIPPGDDAALAGLLNLLLHNRVHLAILAYNARQRYEAHPTWSQSMQGVLEWLHESSSAISPQN